MNEQLPPIDPKAQYGSYARNEQDHESDLDVMVLVQSEEEISKECNEEISELIFQLSLKHGILLSPIIKDEQKFYEYTDYVPFYTNVLKEGVGIYPGIFPQSPVL